MKNPKASVPWNVLVTSPEDVLNPRSQVPDFRWADPAKLKKADLWTVWQFFYDQCFEEEAPISFLGGKEVKRVQKPGATDDESPEESSDDKSSPEPQHPAIKAKRPVSSTSRDDEDEVTEAIRKVSSQEPESEPEHGLPIPQDFGLVQRDRMNFLHQLSSEKQYVSLLSSIKSAPVSAYH